MGIQSSAAVLVQGGGSSTQTPPPQQGYHFDYSAFTARLSLQSFGSNLVETSDICMNITLYIIYTCICTCIKPTWNGTERLLKPPSCWNCKTDEMLCPNKTNELSCISNSALEISYWFEKLFATLQYYFANKRMPNSHTLALASSKKFWGLGLGTLQRQKKIRNKSRTNKATRVICNFQVPPKPQVMGLGRCKNNRRSTRSTRSTGVCC